MDNIMKVSDLRNILTQSNSTWTIDDRLQADDPVPHHATGCDLSKVPRIAEVPRVDISVYLGSETSNPFLRQLRINSGFLKTNTLVPEIMERIPLQVEHLTKPNVIASPLTGNVALPSSVDWRNRWGWPWITQIKDQGQCGSCWVFGAVGVVEAMTRIEHTIWSLRSEGDVHDGMGWACKTDGTDGGNPQAALDWIKQNGVADPGCWAYQTQNKAYAPTPDRTGRTVKLDSYVQLNNVNDQKNWLDKVGPIAACFTCYWDFQAYGANSGVYHCNTTSGVDGGHCIVIVGYDDTRQAWLVRNSWGTNWGMSGYCWFGYGQAGIDDGVKLGIPGSSTNPDAWTKRRAHNGNFFESGDGQIHRNFEVWTVASGNAIRHYWRDGVTLNWSLAETQENNCAASPTVTETTYNRNFEMIYRTTANRLQHRFFDQASSNWVAGPIFGPIDVNGIPGFIQSDYGAPGNFEVVVLRANGMLEHWWRDDGAGLGFPWHLGSDFGTNIAHSSSTLIQRWDHGLDLIAVNKDGSMQRWWRDDPHTMTWAACEKFGNNVSSSPVMIRSGYGESDENFPGNYELCVAVNGLIQHWWTAGNAPATWSNSASFGTNIVGKSIQQVLGLIESSFGFDLELVALLNDGSLQHFWRDGNGWHAGPVFGSVN